MQQYLQSHNEHYLLTVAEEIVPHTLKPPPFSSIAIILNPPTLLISVHPTPKKALSNPMARKTDRKSNTRACWEKNDVEMINVMHTHTHEGEGARARARCRDKAKSNILPDTTRILIYYTQTRGDPQCGAPCPAQQLSVLHALCVRPLFSPRTANVETARHRLERFSA